METLWILTALVLGLSLDTCQVEGDCPKKYLDIALLGDVSQSMEKHQRNQLIQFVHKLINDLGVSAEGNHYGLITFAGDTKLYNTFKNPQFYNKEFLKSTVSSAISPVPTEWGTRTDLAINVAATKLFTAEGGDRPDAKNLLIVFTDGKPKIAKNDKKPLIPFSQSTKALEDKGVSITVVGIGIGKDVDPQVMQKIAGDKGKVLMYEDFDELAALFNEMMEAAVCPVDGNYTKWNVSQCSVSCGEGVKTYTRTCTNPPPSNGGKDCTDLGPPETKVPCKERECPSASSSSSSSISPSVTSSSSMTSSSSSISPRVSSSSMSSSSSSISPSVSSSSSMTSSSSSVSLIFTSSSSIPFSCSSSTSSSVSSMVSSSSSISLSVSSSSMAFSCSSSTSSSMSSMSSSSSASVSTSVPVPTPVPCTAGLDIGIVLDKSKSVKKGNLRTVIKFLGNLVQTFNPAPDGDHFGFITFNKKANLVFSFADSEYHKKDALLAKIASEPIELGFQTRTDLALSKANDELFTKAGGDRPDKPNIMIVLTDGKPHPKRVADKFKEFADNINKEFKVKKVTTVAVGVGHSVDKDTLHLIAGEGNPVVQVANFDELQGMIDKIKSSACSE